MSNVIPLPTANQRRLSKYEKAQISLHVLLDDYWYDEIDDSYFVIFGGKGERVTDQLHARLRDAIISIDNYDPGLNPLSEALHALCLRRPRNPLLEYINSIKWDGKERLDSWLIDYMGADDEEYTRAVGALTLIAAVRRARKPGCKFDTMIVLESNQGTGKSTALSIIAGEYFTDGLAIGAAARETIEQTRGLWIAEIAELEGLTRKDAETLKAFLSRASDRARPAYGRTVVDKPRGFIVVGTTNRSDYLMDWTGNRRYLPVVTGRIDLDGLRRDRDQLIAEAAEREAAGESIMLPAHLWKVQNEKTEERRVRDPWADKLEDELLPQIQEDHGTELRVFTNMLLPLLTFASQGAATDARRLRRVMNEIGWKYEKNMMPKLDGKRARGYVKAKTNEN